MRRRLVVARALLHHWTGGGPARNKVSAVVTWLHRTRGHRSRLLKIITHYREARARSGALPPRAARRAPHTRAPKCMHCHRAWWLAAHASTHASARHVGHAGHVPPTRERERTNKARRVTINSDSRGTATAPAGFPASRPGLVSQQFHFITNERKTAARTHCAFIPPGEVDNATTSVVQRPRPSFAISCVCLGLTGRAVHSMPT